MVIFLLCPSAPLPLCPSASLLPFPTPDSRLPTPDEIVSNNAPKTATAAKEFYPVSKFHAGIAKHLNLPVNLMLLASRVLAKCISARFLIAFVRQVLWSYCLGYVCRCRYQWHSEYNFPSEVRSQILTERQSGRHDKFELGLQ